jgi:hypothetical protein
MHDGALTAVNASKQLASCSNIEHDPQQLETHQMHGRKYLDQPYLYDISIGVMFCR